MALGAVLVALLFAVVYLIWQPRTVDLAAHTFRADLFGQEGFTIWNGQWYGGHHTPAYSIISPPLAWLLGPAAGAGHRRRGLRRAVRAAGPRLLRRASARAGERSGSASARPRCSSPAGCPFAIGVAFGLAALLALQRRRYALAVVLAVLCPLGSPVAGLFLAMAGVAFAIAAGARPHRSAARASPSRPRAFIPPVFLALGVPGGRLGARSRSSAYLPIPLFAMVCLLVLPRAGAALRWGAALYGLGATAALLHRHADGRQRGAPRRALRRTRARVRALGPAAGRRRAWALPVLAVVLGALAFWQWSPAVRDVIKYLEDPAAKSDYFEPLRQYLATLPDQRRIEIPFTRSHWEGAEIALHTPLARGWLRQLDTGRNPIFYQRPAQPAHLRELAGRERRALRGAARAPSRTRAPTASGR